MNFQFTWSSLRWLFWQLTHIFFSWLNWTKPFFGKRSYLIGSYITCYRKYGIYGTVMFKEKVFYILQLRIFNMRKFFSNSHPTIGVYLVSEIPQFKPRITIGFVEIVFLEFFDHHFTLYF